VNGLLQIFFQLCHVLFGHGQCFFGTSPGVWLGPLPLPPNSLVVPEGSLKYPATASLMGLLVLVSQRTIKSDIIAVTKIGVGNFPCAAVVPAVAAFLLDDDNRRAAIVNCTLNTGIRRLVICDW